MRTPVLAQFRQRCLQEWAFALLGHQLKRFTEGARVRASHLRDPKVAVKLDEHFNGATVFVHRTLGPLALFLPALEGFA
ncbi:hypothetical protein ACVWZV_003364 [Bradyrhizobium sp. GM5.1]